MKKLFIGAFVVVLLTSMLFGLTILSGLQVERAQSTDLFFQTQAKSAGIPYAGALTDEQTEAVLEHMHQSGEDYSVLDGAWPYTLDALYAFLQAERQTYGTAVQMGERRHFSIREDYDYDEDEGYMLDDRRVETGATEVYEVFDQKTYEYDYRVPWQILAASRYVFEFPVELDFFSALVSDYVYAVPYQEMTSPIFTGGSAELQSEMVEISNHIPAEKKSLYVPISSGFEPLLNVPLGTDENYIRVNGIEEVRTEETNVTKYYKYDSEGHRKLKSTDRAKEVVRDITVDMATPRPLVTRSLYGDVHYSYDREQVTEQIDYDYSVRKYYNDDGDLRKKRITTSTVTLVFDKMVPSADNLTADIHKYLDFFNERGYAQEDAQYILNLASILPGASEFSQRFASGFGTPNALYLKQGLSSSQYSYISLSPSELDLAIPRFYQNDSRWSHMPFGSSTVGRAGCGPTSMAMVVTGLTDQVILPPEMCSIAASAGYKSSEGLIWSFYSYAAPRFGLQVQELYPSASGNQAMLALLSAGNPVIVSVHEGHFTSEGHFIVLTGITENGMIEVNDPYDPYMSKNHAWPPSIILDEANAYFVIMNPAADQEDVKEEEEEING